MDLDEKLDFPEYYSYPRVIRLHIKLKQINKQLLDLLKEPSRNNIEKPMGYIIYKTIRYPPDSIPPK